MILNFLIFFFFIKILIANRIAPDWAPRSAASHLVLYCLPMPRKKDARQNAASHLGLYCLLRTHKKDTRLKDLSILT